MMLASPGPENKNFELFYKDSVIVMYGRPGRNMALFLERGIATLLLLPFFFLSSACGFIPFWSGTAEKNIKGANVMETAQSQLGKRYRPGGASPQRGFDCSGLVWWSYRQHGINVPRITTDQAKTGKAVSKKSPRPGDIVIFRTGNSPRGLHSGIYCGKDTFVHSPGKGKKVCLDKLSAEYWKNRLVAVRRVASN